MNSLRIDIDSKKGSFQTPGSPDLSQAKDGLSMDQQQLADIIEFLPDATLAIDQNGHIIIWNRAIEIMTGIPAKDMIGKGDYAYTIPFYGEARPLLIDLAFTGDKDIEDLYPNIIHEGKTLITEIFCKGLNHFRGAWVLAKASPLHDQSGQVIGAIEIIRDITERINAQKALQESEARYKNLFENSHAVMLIIDPSTATIIDANQAACAYYGWDRETLLKIKIDEINTLTTEEVMEEMRLACLEKRNYFIFKHRLSDGSIRDVETYSGPILISDKKMLYSIIHDITERKRTEEALLESQKKYQYIFENIQDVYFETSLDGTILEVSPSIAFLSRNQYHRDELLGMVMYDFYAYPKERVNILTELLENGYVKDFEVTLRNRDGSLYICSITARVIKDNQDRPIKIIGSMDDITDRISNETNRQQAEEALRANRRQLTDIIQFLPDATLAINNEKRVIIWNKAIEDMTGIPATEMIGKGDYAYSVPFYGEPRPQLVDLAFEDHEEIVAKYPQIIREGRNLVTEVFCNALNNYQGAWVYAKASPLHDQSGNIIGAIESIRDITDRKLLQEELQRQATTDELTGVSNRRYFMTLALIELKRAVRFNSPLALAMIDIDFFKQINDKYGHTIGDQTLIGFVDLCRKLIREIDVIGRLGGDEFALLLPETNLEQAYRVVERIRSKLDSKPMKLKDKEVWITISSGISSLRNKDESLDTILGRADQALYRSKEKGRNCVTNESYGK